MKLKVQKRLAASVLKASKKRIRLDTAELEDIKESITKADIRGLVADKVIIAIPKKGISRGRVSKKKKGSGSRKGTANARSPRKKVWMNHIRSQRDILRELKEREMISTKAYRDLYLKAKGGFFRSKRHLKLYIQEHNLIIQKDKGSQ